MVNKQTLEIINEVTANKKCVMINLDAAENIIDFEINMLQNNPSLPFLHLNQLQVDDKKRLIYDVGSRESLKDFISNSSVDKCTLLDIIESIFKIIKSSNEFMLDNNKIIFNLDFIFVDKGSSLVYMIFVPIDMEYEYSIEEEFITMCGEILSKLKVFKKEMSISEKKIITILNSRNFNFEKLEQAFQLYNSEKNNIINNKKKLLLKNNNDESEIDTQIDIQDNIKILKEKSNVKDYVNVEENSAENSIIEENYEDIDGSDLSYVEDEEENDEENDEDLNYKEYKDIQRYEKASKNNKAYKVLILQLVVLMLIGSIALLFSVDDKQFFTMMIGIMVIVFLLLIILSVISVKKMRE